jgi:hypothetical protein
MSFLRAYYPDMHNLSLWQPPGESFTVVYVNDNTLAENAKAYFVLQKGTLDHAKARVKPRDRDRPLTQTQVAMAYDTLSKIAARVDNSFKRLCEEARR